MRITYQKEPEVENSIKIPRLKLKTYIHFENLLVGGERGYIISGNNKFDN